MAEIQFELDWQDGEGVMGPELSATMASLRLRIRDRIVTEVHDRRARTVRDSVFVPLYPLAEWLVSNWWFLAFESENPSKRSDGEFRRRHALLTNTSGYALPGLEITSSGRRTQISWGRDTSEWTSVNYLHSDRTTVDRDEFLAECSDLVDIVIRRLEEFDVRDTFLQDEWAAIQAADEEEASFCEIAAGLGWDPYDLDDARRQQVFRITNDLGPLLGEAVAVMDAVNPVEDASAILTALEAAQPNGVNLHMLRPLKHHGQSLKGHPWQAGYALARQARDRLQLGGDPIPSLEVLADALDERVESIRRAAQPFPHLHALPLVDGVVRSQDHDGVGFGLRPRGADGWRFLFCRALGEALTSDRDSLVTKGHTERQQRNRAFAAEFLAPGSSLKQRIHDPVVESEQVEDLAEEFAVSEHVIVRQVQNHQIAHVSEATLATEAQFAQ